MECGAHRHREAIINFQGTSLNRYHRPVDQVERRQCTSYGVTYVRPE